MDPDPAKATSNPQEQGGQENVNGSALVGKRDAVKNLLDMSEDKEIAPETSDPECISSGGKPISNGESMGTVVVVPSSTTKMVASKQEDRIRELEELLAASKAMVDSLSQNREENPKKKKKKGKKNDNETVDSSILMELQEKLQSEMALKAEAENKMRLAQKQVADLQSQSKEQTAESEMYKGLKKELEEARGAKQEVESNLASLLDRIQVLETENNAKQMELEELHKSLAMNKSVLTDQDQEIIKLREQRDEQERKEMSLTNRLNAAKKKEAVKANQAEKYEEELKLITKELEEAKTQVEELKKTKESIQKELEGTILSSRQRQVQTEAALAEERKLNEDRKQKMKVFIEKKSEELRQAKADNESLQVELNQTSRSLSELNIRWKQLHAQWVQSQTRNRELQREFHRIKKDSENLHKVGDTLEMKLSRSATETEEHKNKRLAAKNELMEVLRTLEAEREVSARLRDSIKFTFTPKALSQQQLLNESLADFNSQLIKLSMRLRKPLPFSSSEADASSSHQDDTNSNDDGWIESMDDEDGGNGDIGGNTAFSRSDRETHRLIEKLNRETQQVSKCIMALVGGIERMHLMLDSSGDRSCYSVFSDILTTTGSVVYVDPTGRQDETTAMTGTQMHSITSRHYHN